MSSIKEVQRQVAVVNAANGWTLGATLREQLAVGVVDEQRVVDHQIAVLALITTEVSEAIEEIRNGHSITETYYSINGERVRPGVGDFAHLWEGESGEVSWSSDQVPKPEGVPSELADVVIRALDFADTWGIDLEQIIAEKLTYNATRGQRHGGKRL